MTKDEVLKLAKECGAYSWKNYKCAEIFELTSDELLAFANAIEKKARDAQREIDAKICETTEIPFDIDIWHGSTKKEMTARTAMALADAIRANKE